MYIIVHYFMSSVHMFVCTESGAPLTVLCVSSGFPAKVTASSWVAELLRATSMGKEYAPSQKEMC